MMINLDDLPAELLPFKDNILATVKPVIEITLSSAENLDLWASKVGGKPYLPLDFEYPHDKNNEAMAFLAQLDLANLPKSDLLPSKGLLSFFIADGDCKVLYFPEINQKSNSLWQDFEPLDIDESLLPYLDNDEYTMNFQLQEKPISLDDKDFRKSIFKNSDDSILDSDDFYELLSHHKLFNNAITLLGYPDFVQFTDPREHNEKINAYILLFQLDTHGDGILHFFIHPTDLENLDFSNVFFYWDNF